MSRRARLLTVLVGLLVVSAPMVGVTTTVLAASNPTVSVDAPDSLTTGNTTSATLEATDVTASDDIGAYELNITYDPSAVSISVSGATNFTVETSTTASGVISVVGYTDELDTPNGTLTLAGLTLTGESATGSTAIDVSVESVSDTDGNSVPVSTGSATVTIAEPATPTPTPTPTDDDDTGGQSGGTGQTGPVDTATPQPSPSEGVSVNISDADPDRPGTTVQFRNVSVSEITFADEGVSGSASVRDLGTDLPDEVRSASGSEDVVHAVEITVPETARNRSATIRLSVPRAALNGVAPANARVARFADGTWQLLETRVISTDGPIVLEADTPGFSVFGVMASQETATATATATATETVETASPTEAVTETEAGTVSERKPTETASATPATASEVPTASPTEAVTEVTDSPTTTEEPDGGLPWSLIAGAILVLAVLALIAMRVLRE